MYTHHTGFRHIMPTITITKLKLYGSRFQFRRNVLFKRVNSARIDNNSITEHIFWCQVKIVSSLPDEIILAQSVNTFKTRLDKFWAEQEVFFTIIKPIKPGTRKQMHCR